MSDFHPYPKPVKTKKVSRKDRWDKIRTKVVKPIFKKLNINYCEVTRYLYSFEMITEEQAVERNYNFSFHHRHKRDWYKQFGFKKEGELLGDYSQVLFIGQYYHNMLEGNEELTKQWFDELRGEEEI